MFCALSQIINTFLKNNISNSVLSTFKWYQIAILYFYLAKIEIAQKVANWQFLSCQFATFQFKTKNWSAKNTTHFDQSRQLATFWIISILAGQSKKLLFDIIWKYKICCYLASYSKLSKELKNGIGILAGQLVLNYISKQSKLFWSITAWPT